MGDVAKYNEMFDYLSDVPAPQPEDGLLVFGRKDLLVAHTTGRALMDGIGSFAIISGGVGKDSGDLRVSEAEYLGSELEVSYPDIVVPVLLETKATNGGENVRNSLSVLDKHGLPYRGGLTTVAHATSARRLNEMLKHGAIKGNTPIARIGGIATTYEFNATNPADQDEATAELLRLAQWPDRGWLQPQTDLPQNLVDFATDKKERQTPQPTIPVLSAIFSKLPQSAQRFVVRKLYK